MFVLEREREIDDDSRINFVTVYSKENDLCVRERSLTRARVYLSLCVCICVYVCVCVREREREKGRGRSSGASD